MKPNSLRKAAVLLRSLDSDTATLMLAQFPPDEASSIRAAIRELGEIDPEEQADVAAEFRRVRPIATEQGSIGVELALSPEIDDPNYSTNDLAEPTIPSSQRFEFLANAPTSALVPFLAREHSQTIAVVLSHLAPARAAAVLEALPDPLQSETIERLAALGETDPESVMVLERELSAWLATRREDRGTIVRRREAVANILAAVDVKTRRSIVNKLRSHNFALAEQLAPRETATVVVDAMLSSERGKETKRHTADGRFASKQAFDTSETIRRRLMPALPPKQSFVPPAPVPRPAPPPIEFDRLIHLDPATLTAVLRDVDATVLAIALAGSRDEFVERVCGEMPKRTARTFRRELRRLGPTRLSDVEAAQRAVAESAARLLAERRTIVTNR